MDLDFSDDQRLLAESVERLLANRYSLEQRRAHTAQPEGWSRAVWNELGEMGLFMLPFPKGDGGLGLGGVEAMIIGEAFGRHLALEPYLASVILAGSAIRFGGDETQRAALLPGIMSGSVIAALADTATIERQPAGQGWMLSGRATTVLGGDAADLLILPAGGELFAVAADEHGLTRRNHGLHGGGGAAELKLDGVILPEEARLTGQDAFSRALEAGIAFLAAEAAGIGARALEVTVDYIKTREQFGRPIGANQALQHRAAEMLVEVEQLRSAALYAALLGEQEDSLKRARAFCAVKAVIGKTSRFVAEQAVHLHGGMGVSEEHLVSHQFRRLTAIRLMLGDSDAHLVRLAALGGFTGPEPHWAGTR